MECSEVEPASQTPTKLRKATVLSMTLAVSILFVAMISGFLMPLLLAAIFSALIRPLYVWLAGVMRGHETVAALTTLVILVLLVVLPLLGLLGIVGAQAIELSERVVPWVKNELGQAADGQFTLPSWVPFRKHIQVSSDQVVAKASEIASQIGSFLLRNMSNATQGTAAFLLSLFIMLYAMFFFLTNGPEMLRNVLRYLPLSEESKQQLLEKGYSITRATLKGTIVIGVIQGFLGGIGFAVAGIQGAVFWGAVMVLASAIPSVGTALVWIPAVIYLIFTGDIGWAIALAIWCAGAVGSVDNLLRPRLVGRDTQMSDLLILVSTLGGISMFGAIGLLIGPVLAGIFVTMWEISADTFSRELDLSGDSTPGA
jgi:predicted PurR-regulated permease PerM